MAKGQGRSYNQRLKLFHLLDYLMENTDIEPGHTVKTSQIVEHLNEIGVPIETKTVVTDIHLLEEYGIEIDYDYKEQRNRQRHLLLCVRCPQL